MTSIKFIRKEDWVVAWRGTKSSHVYLRDGDVAFFETEMFSVGVHYEEEVSQGIVGWRLKKPKTVPT